MRRTKRRLIALPVPQIGSGNKLTDIAEKVLDQLTAPQYLAQQVIVQRAIRNELLPNPEKTPTNTLLTQIELEVDRDQRRGVVPRFVLIERDGTKVVGLSRWSKDTVAIEGRLKQHNQTEYRKIATYLTAMSPEKFEELVGLLLSHLGFDPIEVTGKSNDGGIDVRGTLSVGDIIHIEMAVQVKRWVGNVGSPIVRELHGSLGPQERGLIITTSDFTQDARKAAVTATRPPIELVNGQQLVALLVEHELLSRRTRYDWIDFQMSAEYS